MADSTGFRTALKTATALVALGLASSASAGDRNAAWEGPYIGGHLGYSWMDVALSATPPAQSWSQEDDGFFGGVFVGYNFDLGLFLLGLEADTGFGDITDREARAPFGNVRVTHHGQHTFRVRAGITQGPALFYGTVGLALADFRIRTALGNEKDFYLGLAAGAGIEAKLMENWSVRAEYLYATYGEKDFNIGGVATSTDFDTHNLRIGVSYHFKSLLP